MSSTADSFLGRPQGRILLLGTFHFHNAGRDAYKPHTGAGPTVP